MPCKIRDWRLEKAEEKFLLIYSENRQNPSFSRPRRVTVAKECVILLIMVGERRKFFPIELLLNYWELNANSLRLVLEELYQRGIFRVSSFVPWPAFETDISHSLLRFLQLAADHHIHVTLLISPELGVHFPNSGIPKDILKNTDTLAKSSEDKWISVFLPPNQFYLPSQLASDFQKRYSSFLSKFQVFLSDLEKNYPLAAKGLSVSLGGGLWKYYRSPRTAAIDFFEEETGDRSKGAALSYRRWVEEYYAQEEFLHPNPSDVNRWKSRRYEEVNRRHFSQHAEDLSRMRAHHLVNKGVQQIPILHHETFTPEADPGFIYGNVLRWVLGETGDFHRLSSYLDQACLRRTVFQGEICPNLIFWTSMGNFSKLADSERQFLILKSILLAGSTGGSVLVEYKDWLSFSNVFRSRTEALARQLFERKLRLKPRVAYLAPHVWSAGGALWEQLANFNYCNTQYVASSKWLQQDRSVKLLCVDPAYIFRKEEIVSLLNWVEQGKVLVIPRSPLFTYAAQTELEKKFKAHDQQLDLSLGIPYTVHAVGRGKLVIFELPDRKAYEKSGKNLWNPFVQSILGLSDQLPMARFENSKLTLISLERVRRWPEIQQGIFVLNSAPEAISSPLLFNTDVFVSDLATAFSGELGGIEASHAQKGRRFQLEVPPRGILPLAVQKDIPVKTEPGVELFQTEFESLAKINMEVDPPIRKPQKVEEKQWN